MILNSIQHKSARRNEKVSLPEIIAYNQQYNEKLGLNHSQMVSKRNLSNFESINIVGMDGINYRSKKSLLGIDRIDRRSSSVLDKIKEARVSQKLAKLQQIKNTQIKANRNISKGSGS